MHNDSVMRPLSRLVLNTMSWLVSVTKTSLQIRINIFLLSRLRSSDDIVTSGLEQAVEVWALTSLETGFGGEWLRATVGDVGVHVLAFVAEVRAGSVLLGWDVVWSLDPLEGKTSVNVPDDVAMHEPCTWIVGLEANDSVAGWAAWTGGTSKHGSVTTRWVIEVQGAD